MHTSKLFHTVVVLGMAVAAGAACSSSTEPTPVADAGSSGATTSGGTSGATSGGTSGATSGGTSGTSGGVVDSGTVADAATDAFAGWFCCG